MDLDFSGRTIWGEAHWAAKAMLDTLIQLQQPLDPSALTTVSQRFPIEATILLLQNASGDPSLLAAIRAMPVSRAVWLAAGNALAHRRAPGFAAALLRELPLTTTVVVLDPGHPPQGSAGNGMLSSWNMRVPPDFPPVTLYWLTAKRVAGDELSSDGRTPIYRQRAVLDPGVDRRIDWPEDAQCFRCQPNCPECQRERADYLAELAQWPVGLDRVIRHQLILEWSTPAQLDAAISRSLAEQESEVRSLVQRLSDTNALQDSERKMAFQIEVRMLDERSDKSVPIPRHPVVEFRID